jgi:thiol-disulfide isomerase/thioredoxin
MTGRLPRIVRTALVVLLVQGLAVLVYLGVARHRAPGLEQPFRYERLPAGRSAPDLILVGPDGSTRRLSDSRGETVLLHFWATWCPPCREELPQLLALGRDLARGGRLEVVLVTLDEDWAAVRTYFGGEIPRGVVMEKSGHSTRAYAVSALPDTYVVAPDGALTLRFGGARDWRGAAAREVLKRQLEPR